MSKLTAEERARAIAKDCGCDEHADYSVMLKRAIANAIREAEHAAASAMQERCAKVAFDVGFRARSGIRSAKGPRDRSIAIGAEEAAKLVNEQIRALPVTEGQG